MKKYELTDESIQIGERTLFRIKALKDFSNVEKDELGGFVESEGNLSHGGNCWVYDDAWVCGNAQVYGDAQVAGNAQVYGDALVSGNAQVYGDAQVAGNAQVYGYARVYGDARVFDDALIDNQNSYFTSTNVGTKHGVLTVFKCKDGVTKCTRGCFSGTTEEFLEKSKRVHTEQIHHEYKLLIEVGLSIISRSMEA